MLKSNDLLLEDQPRGLCRLTGLYAVPVLVGPNRSRSAPCSPRAAMRYRLQGDAAGQMVVR